MAYPLIGHDNIAWEWEYSAGGLPIYVDGQLILPGKLVLEAPVDAKGLALEA